MPRYIDNETRQEILSAVHMTQQEEAVENILKGIPKADDEPSLSPLLVANMDKMIEKTFPNDANEDDDVSLTITCTMRKDCMREFLSFLARIEYDGSVGHSEVIAFFADGDGTFRPKFVADEPVRRGHWVKKIHEWDLGDPPYDYTDFTCSNCRIRVDNKTSFCPDCGAKMDEEGER